MQSNGSVVMTSSATARVDALVTEVRALLQRRTEALELLAEALAGVEAAFEVTDAPVAAPVQALEPVKERASAPRAGQRGQRPVREPSGEGHGKGRPRLDLAVVRAAILGALKAGAANGITISGQIGVNKFTVRGELEQLVRDRLVTRSGAGRHTLFSLPGGGPQSQAAVVAVSADDAGLVTAIRRVLKHGASVDPREVRRAIVATHPSVSLEVVAAALEALAKAGTIERIGVSPTIKRYRALAKKAEVA